MAHVVSVNVGQPREIPWRGKSVRTAIFKQPLPGRVFVNRLNIIGDAQADLVGHGGEQRALLVYQRESYRHWEAHLKRGPFEPGAFGENLTVDGLPDNEVCIGDRYRIGDAVFEVSQPRVTCFKLGIKLDAPELPALLVAHGRPGFYFRVITEGEVGAGDRIDKVLDGPEAISVARMDALLYSSDHPIDDLRRAVKVGALSPGWQQSMRSLLDAGKRGDAIGNPGLGTGTVPPAWTGYRQLRVVATRMESDTIRSFELGAPDGSPLPTFLPGQHIVVRIQPDGDNTRVSRSYSLCGAVGEPTYRIAVKDEHGAMSGRLHHHVALGDLLEVSAPRGDFILTPGDRPIVLLSAGVGVTPMLAMLLAARAEHPRRLLWWIHSARNRAAQAFADQVATVLADTPEARSHVVYSRPDPGDRLGNDYDEEGHVSVGRLIGRGMPSDADFYACGPAPYLDAIREELLASGVPASQIHEELFAARSNGSTGELPHQPTGPQGTGPLVLFAKSELTVPWGPRFTSLLELAEACSVPVGWSCRTGVCHQCESAMVDGKVRYVVDPLDPPAPGNILMCCAVPCSDLELDL